MGVREIVARLQGEDKPSPLPCYDESPGEARP